MSIFDFSYEFPSTIEELDNFSGKEFEEFLFRFFNALGHEASITDDTNDKGIDLIVEFKTDATEKSIGIQAKRWKSKVGANEIRSMLDGKRHYRLDEVWIVTTSDLTSAAITTALNNKIEIVNRDRVAQFLDELKKIEGIRFRALKNKSKTTSKNSKEIEKNSSKPELYETLRKFRLNIANKYKIKPIYMVYNNATLEDLMIKKPKTLEELKNVKGFVESNITLFGEEIIAFFINKSDKNNKMIKHFENLRKKITSYNKLETEHEVYTDETLLELVEKKPTTINELRKIKGFDETKIELFGNYLIGEIIKLKTRS